MNEKCIRLGIRENWGWLFGYMAIGPGETDPSQLPKPNGLDWNYGDWPHGYIVRSSDLQLVLGFMGWGESELRHYAVIASAHLSNVVVDLTVKSITSEEDFGFEPINWAPGHPVEYTLPRPNHAPSSKPKPYRL